MGSSKSVYTETMVLVDAVLDGDITEDVAAAQISESYGAPFGEFLREELEAERARRTPGADGEEKYLQGLIFTGTEREVGELLGDGGTGFNVKVYVSDRPGDFVLQGFADVYRAGGGIAARIFLSKYDLVAGRKMWPALDIVSVGGPSYIESITLCPWPSHNPALPALKEVKVSKG